VKGSGNVEELRVEAELPLTALLRGEQINANRMIEEQVGGMLAENSRGLLHEHGIRNGEIGRKSWHGFAALENVCRDVQ
jgi:hypothetical protein